MLFYSDRFHLDPKTLRLINRRPENLPDVVLEDAADPHHFTEVDQILRVFEGTKILSLDQLNVQGKVILKGLTLKGKIKISNRSDHEVNFADVKDKILENTSIEINKTGQVKFEKIQN